MDSTTMNATSTNHSTAPPSYFNQPGYSLLLWGHILLSIAAWVFILPVGIFLSIGRSKFAFPAQLAFTAVNGVALSLGTIYNAKTPDLYENNAHHTLGWVVTVIMGVQTLMTLIRAYAPKGSVGNEHTSYTFIPVQYKPILEVQRTDEYRWSGDSGHASEESASHRGSPPSSPISESGLRHELGEQEPVHDVVLEDEKHGLLGNGAVDRLLSSHSRAVVIRNVMYALGILHELTDRTILILGFVAIVSGICTYGGLEKGHAIFGGLAHFIKGGIFFWYGLLTVGRVMGSFADLGWAWNMKLPADVIGARKAALPSIEFFESLLIFFYGSTNVFLEHLGSDGKWYAQDLEHLAITILFFGGGLCSMLVESKSIRRILNSTVTSLPSVSGYTAAPVVWEEPGAYGYSLNPLPGIIIMLLGIMMSSHHQESMVSTMLHTQWGTLFVVASLARGVTYVLTYLSPPKSYLPGRPPSEIVAGFCFTSGGLIFMCSDADVVAALENQNLNAMFLFTTLMGLTAFLMAWEIVVLTIKGLAVQRERRMTFKIPGQV